MKCKFSSIIFIILLVSNFNVLYGQKNYKHYYKIVNKAEELFIKGKVSQSFEKYDNIFASKSYKPFVFDVYKAAQYAYISNDTARFLKYISVAANNGMPSTAFYAAPVFKSVKKLARNNPLAIAITNCFRNKHYAPVGSYEELKKFYSYCYQRDSLYSLINLINKDSIKAKIWREYEDSFRNYIVSDYLSKGLFLSDKYLGIKTDMPDKRFPNYDNPKWHYGKDLINDSSIESKDISIVDIDTLSNRDEYSLSNISAFSPFLHYSCSFKKYKKLFWKAVQNGWLPPKYYAVLEEGNVFKRFGSGHDNLNINSCNYALKKCYYNTLNAQNYPEEIQQYITTKKGMRNIERNRRKLYIRKYSTEVLMKELESKQHLRLFFGFINYL